MSKQPTEHELFLAKIRSVAATDDGADVIWHLLSLCNIYGCSYSDSSTNLAFAEGRRAVGVEFLMTLEEADPKLYATLILNNIQRD